MKVTSAGNEPAIDADAKHPRRGKLRPGGVVAERELSAISGAALRLPDPQRLTHLQFRRFAGCPVCHLHLRAFVTRSSEIAAAGISEIVVFHSSREALLEHASDFPFPIVADPTRSLYLEFGVEAAPRALLDPRAWWPVVRAIAYSAWGIVRHGRRMPPLAPQGGSLGLPADFLIGRDGRVRASRYGAHANDQWSVDELLALASASAKADAQRPLGPASTVLAAASTNGAPARPR